MLTCRKVYAEIPFAHRQHLHAGHCAHVHGHSWTISLTFACREPDRHGFVVDFGGLRFLREWIDTHLDHAFVVSADDPELAWFRSKEGRVFKLLVVESAAAEGIARHLHAVLDPLVRQNTGGRAWIAELELHEDSRNAVRFVP